MRFNYFILLIFPTVHVKCNNHEDYYKKRAEILSMEEKLSVGANMTLSEKEVLANECLMRWKDEEIDYVVKNPQFFKLSQHYFEYKEFIKKSKVYKFIKNMPKGALLHVHGAMVSAGYLMNITYREHLYVCFDKTILFLFSKNVPDSSCNGTWKLLKDIRYSSKNITVFDLQLKKSFIMVVDDQHHAYASIKDGWEAFDRISATVMSLLRYRPVWEQYFYDALKTIRNDNVMYVEIRRTLPQLYELDGTVHSQLLTAESYRKTLKKFIKDYPDFIGAKLIYAPRRQLTPQDLTEYLKFARHIKETMPEFFAGFDLVGQEDLGNPLVDFVTQLKDVKDLNFFFHAGETDCNGCSTDENLVDAILLGAKRIGHAYALSKHPVLIKYIVQGDIALEVNVLSNTMLSLVQDVRNHPLSVFLSLNVPVVLSSDDPGAWDAEPLTDDFYVAFVGVASRHADLRMLKTLAINSLKYSALEPLDKEEAMRQFHLRWNSFINEFVCL